MLHQAPAGEVMGMLAKSFLEDEELARTALGCHLSMNLFLPDARLSRVTREFSWQSDGGCTSHLAFLWAARVGRRGLKQPCFSDACFPCFVEGGICPPDTWAAGVAPGSDTNKCNVATTPLSQSIAKTKTKSWNVGDTEIQVFLKHPEKP